jgi:tetratricopeptide (TPR) repeat protein
VWTDELRTRLQARFAASMPSVPYAADTAQRVIARLDAWRDRWDAIDLAGCRATRDGTLTTAMRDRQTVCLQRQLGEVRALVDVFVEADAAVVERAVAAVERVTAVDSCEDVVALSAAVSPPPADQRGAVDTVRDRVAGARALHVAGRARQALAIAEPAAVSARATGYRAVEAEALAVLGALRHDLDDDAVAERDLRAAIAAAEAAADDHLRAEAMIELGYVLQVGERTAELDHLLADTRALVERLHGDVELAADVAALSGNLRNARGDYAGALEHFRAALAGRIALGERAGTSVASSRQAAGITLNRMGRYAEALAELEAALATLEGALGADHPRVADVRHDIAQTLNALGRLDDARVVLERVLATRVVLLGDTHSDVARTRADLALVLLDLERPDDARREIDAAIAALTASLGPEHSDVVVAITYRGDIEALQGDPTRGLADYQRAIDLTERKHGRDHPRLADLYGRKADALRHLKRYPEAIAAAQRSQDVRARGLAPDDPLLAYGIHALGLIHLDAGDPRKALPLLERALDLRAAAGDALDPLEVANSRFAVARALRALGRDPARAAELARAAREGFVGAGPAGNDKLAETDAFLKN